jgi:hypothetical protein
MRTETRGADTPGCDGTGSAQLAMCWTFARAPAAAVASLDKVCGLAQGTISAMLEAYFKTKLGVTDGTTLRAGEHGTMKDASESRRSTRDL